MLSLVVSLIREKRSSQSCKDGEKHISDEGWWLGAPPSRCCGQLVPRQGAALPDPSASSKMLIPV